jgi:hypothetical protein
MRQLIFCTFLMFLIFILISFYQKTSESFIGDMNAQQCGVDQPPCPFGTACMNGWCVGTNPPALPSTTGLPVLP